MKKNEKIFNSPIKAVIKNYCDKDSGKVTVARDEIKRRFNGLDWKDQKKVLEAFLESNKSDRQWAYGELMNWWDDCFRPSIERLWDEYAEERCAWVIIRHFPVDWLAAHADLFTQPRDYYFICRRLATNPDYEIDRSLLSGRDYLSVLYHAGRDITEEDARDTLFGVVHDCCLETPGPAVKSISSPTKKTDVIAPREFYEVYLSIYFLRRLMRYDVMYEFNEWNREVEETIWKSPEFKAISRDECLSYEYDSRRLDVTCFYAYQALADKYKLATDPSIGEMCRRMEERREWYLKQRNEEFPEDLSDSALNSFGLIADRDSHKAD